MINNRINILLLISTLLFALCSNPSASNKGNSTELSSKKVYQHVDWSKNSNIYEVNVRQYTPEGTFKAFEEHMPRLQKMGVDILWLMPIHPISKKNRKGTMGSYYAVQDYQKVNPEFGTLDDLKHMVNYAHELGMKVIIDWVANHTGWDNWLIEQHADWYTQDSTGQIIFPLNTDWTDVADLNYDNPDLRKYMIESLQYWIKEADIDGYRCDVAGMVPIDFWVDARKSLDAIKPIFMLAEEGNAEIHKAFDMSYGWEFHHIMNEIAKGNKGTDAIDSYLTKVDSTYQPDDYIMNFTSNHDENSWNGTEFERMGKAYKAFAVLSATMPGMPLIYTGQEDKLNKRLAFFDKDTVNWKSFELQEFYSTLLHFKKENKALWNGESGGNTERIKTTADEHIYCFKRENKQDKVIVMLNLSNTNQTFCLKNGMEQGNYLSLFLQAKVVINSDSSFSFIPWEYLILSSE